MAFRKKLFLAYAVMLAISHIFTAADCSLLSEDAADTRNSAALELQRLKSKISLLESRIEDQTSELRTRDDGVKQLGKVIEEKSNTLTSLRSTLQSFQKGSIEVVQISEVKTRVNELEKQIVNIKREIEVQKKKKDALEARANAAEKKIEELNSKLENLRRINDEQNSIIHKTQHALEVAEEEMLKAKLEAYSVTKQLKETHQAWLPLWLYDHLVHCESFVLTHWYGMGRPAMDWTIQKVLELKYEIEDRVNPYIEIIRTKWFPIIKEKCHSILENSYPLFESFVAEAINCYHLARSSIKHYIVNIEDIMDPYFKEARMFVKPYVDHVSEITKPHLDRAQLYLKPYSKQVIHYHEKISNNIQIYHLWKYLAKVSILKVQATLHETLSSYEITKPFATDWLVRLMASVLMALPVVLIFRTLLGGEPKRRYRSTTRSHHRRRPRRVHRDN